MSANQHLHDQAIQHAFHVLGYSNALQGDVLKFLNDLERDTVERLAARLASEKKLSAGPSQRMEETIAEIRNLTKNVYSQTHDHIRKNLIDFAQVEAEGSNKAINQAVKAKVASKLPAPERLKAIVSERPIHGKLLEPWLKGMGEGTANNVEQQIRLGMARGDNIDKIVAAVKGPGGFEGSKASARTMVRTAVAHVSNQAQQETWKANSDIIKGWQFVATLDSRTTLICSNQDGKVYPLGEGPIPPLHPNCRSTTIAVTKSHEDLGIKGAKYTAQTRASMDGQVAAQTTMEKFLRSKDEAFQDSIFRSKVRADLWRKGKLNLNDFIRNYSEVIPLDELRKLHPAAFVEAGVEAVEAEAVALTVDTVAIDAEAKSYVLAMGEKTGNEHLVCYDRNTGATVETKEGDRSSVSFTPKLIDLLDDKDSAIVLHHNHPRSSSLSLPDMLVVTKKPGAAAIWAHGRNGSSFYAERGSKAFSEKTVKALSNAVHAKLQALVTAGIVTVADAMLLDNHLVWLALHSLGQITYQATLEAESLAAFNRNKVLYERILEALK